MSTIFFLFIFPESSGTTCSPLHKQTLSLSLSLSLERAKIFHCLNSPYFNSHSTKKK